jgi:uncharacterized protein YdeI (BOF family)
MKALGAVALAALLAIPVAAQQQGHPQSQQPPQEQQAQKDRQAVGTAGAVTVEAIVDNPERFYNQEVTISGDVGELFGSNKKAFNIKEEGVVDVDDSLLVLSDEAVPNITKDSMVQVRGKVKQFSKADLERDLGISDWDAYGFDQDFWTDHARKPVLIADSVIVRQSTERK